MSPPPTLAPPAPPAQAGDDDNATPGWFYALLACACGLVAANLYYAQPLIGLIAPAIGLPPTAAGFIVTLTQVGYCAGLILLVPLGDLIDHRKLILCTLSLAFVALLMAASAPSAPWFLAAALLTGLGSVVVQMLVPIAAHLAPLAMRGQVIGRVMSGLLIGIMLARPISSLVASAFGWRTVFGASAALMVAIGLILGTTLGKALGRVQAPPAPAGTARPGYGALLASLWTLLRDTPVLRWRAAYQAALFGAFSLYWTAVPLLLASPAFGFSQRGIALFALAGASGAFAAPVSGRLADRGHTRAATWAAMGMVALAFVLAGLSVHADGWAGGTGSTASLLMLLAAGILVDLGVQANLVLGQREIFTLGAHIRSRLNGLYLAIFFAGGALGSAVATLSFGHGGWGLVSLVGLGFAVVALGLHAVQAGRGKK